MQAIAALVQKTLPESEWTRKTKVKWTVWIFLIHLRIPRARYRLAMPMLQTAKQKLRKSSTNTQEIRNNFRTSWYGACESVFASVKKNNKNKKQWIRELEKQLLARNKTVAQQEWKRTSKTVTEHTRYWNIKKLHTIYTIHKRETQIGKKMLKCRTQGKKKKWQQWTRNDDCYLEQWLW